MLNLPSQMEMDVLVCCKRLLHTMRRNEVYAGDLWNPSAGGTPKFMVRALRDPDGASLDRVQIVKGWLDVSDELHEEFIGIACSDDRRVAGIRPCFLWYRAAR